MTALDHVPLEILIHICEYLHCSYKPSVGSLALACKPLYFAALPFLFHTIRIVVRDREQLARHVRLLPPHAPKHVRHLVIEGAMPPPRKGSEDLGPSIDRRPGLGMGKVRNYLDDAIENSFFPDPKYRHDTWFMADRVTPLSTVYAQDGDWLPLAALIEQLPGLSSLNFDCANQLPPCLLEALHAHRPSCRLHMNKFHLRSLDHATCDPHELALATSPCLYSIAFSRASVTPEAKSNYNEEAAMGLIGGLAPNLKEVYMFTTVSLVPLRRRRWQGFPLAQPTKTGKSISRIGSLRRLEYEGSDFARVCSFTDLSVLEVLKLSGKTDLDTLGHLANCDLASLKTLDLTLREHYGESSDMAMEKDEALRHLLGHILPSLNALRLVGTFSRSTYDTILEHGGALRTVHLSPSGGRTYRKFLLRHEIERLAASCPRIEELTLKTPRSQGDMNEVSIYTTLGSFARLQKLILILDASTHPPVTSDYENTTDDATFDDFDRQVFPVQRGNLCNGHIRVGFINSAVDETLAGAIFKAISAAKSAGALSLDSLTLHVCTMDDIGYPDLRLLDAFGPFRNRSRHVERSPRDDRRDELAVTSRNLSDAGEAERDWPLVEEIEPIFRRVWPDDSGNWHRDWYSFPLSGQ